MLLEVLSDKLHAEGLLLTVAVCADPDIAKEGYDFQKVGQWVSLCQEFHPWKYCHPLKAQHP